MSTPCTCPRCSTRFTPRRPGVLAWTRLVLSWAFVALMVALGGMTGPFLVVFSPFIMIAGMSFITPAHAAVRNEPRCPECRAILPAETPRRHVPAQEGFRTPTFAS